MTRMYLSTEATIFAKIGLVFVELLIGLFNIISLPIRMITPKRYALILFFYSVFYVYLFQADLLARLAGAIVAFILFTVSIFAVRAIHKFLNKKVGPKIAMMINSPLGIQLNRFYD